MSEFFKFRASKDDKKRMKEASEKLKYKDVTKFVIDAINEKAGSQIIDPDRKPGKYDHTAPARRAREEAEKQGIIYKKEDQKNG